MHIKIKRRFSLNQGTHRRKPCGKKSRKPREAHALQKDEPRMSLENELVCAVLNLQLYETALLKTK
jgi:hypothetical protein